jgi:hypothetical protein
MRMVDDVLLDPIHPADEDLGCVPRAMSRVTRSNFRDLGIVDLVCCVRRSHTAVVYHCRQGVFSDCGGSARAVALATGVLVIGARCHYATQSQV